MATFAKLDENNIVTTVESLHNNVLTSPATGNEEEDRGINFLRTLHKEPTAIWKQTSYNTHGGVHELGGTPFRKNHASIGYTYDEDRDAFIEPKPYASWVVNETTCFWEAPITKPELTQEQIDNNIHYIWNEDNQTWDLANLIDSS